MQLVDRLTEQPEDFSKVKEIFDLTNLRMFLQFKPKKLTKRTVNKLVGGVVVFGEAETPIELYQEPTSTSQLKEKLRKALKKKQKTNQNNLSSGEEDKSLRKIVGATGFEPATSGSQNQRSARLSYAPNMAVLFYSSVFFIILWQ